MTAALPQRSAIVMRGPLLALLSLVLVAVIWLQRQPVSRYEIACDAVGAPQCMLARVRADSVARTVVPLDSGVRATVKVQPRRRSAPRVLLYLVTPARSVFAAEYEGADATAAAESAANAINDFIQRSSAGAESAASPLRLVVSPPAWFRWGMWMMTAVIVGLIGVVLRAPRAEPVSAPSVGSAWHASSSPPGGPSAT